MDRLSVGIIGNHKSIMGATKERLEQVGFYVANASVLMIIEINKSKALEVRCNTDTELAGLMCRRLCDFGDYFIAHTSKVHSVPYLELCVPEELSPIDITAMGRTIAHVILKFYE